jgi:23S rRNA (uridine2552-2'-O)-methyltransferase
VRERKRDYYYRRAKKEKYRSRATYKLLQVAQKYRFLKKGDVVVDLGAAPGGWLQATRKVVGRHGFILGVDLRNIEPLQASNILTIVGDITDPETQKRIEEILPALADAVVSDASPNISGVWEIDHARQVDLARESLKIALRVLKKNGNFFVKVFQGDMFRDFVEEVGKYFVRVEVIKPEASRSKSAEVFVLGIGLQRIEFE